MSFTTKSLLSKLTGPALTGPALDLIFPMTCAGCGREGKLLCQNCILSLPQLQKPYCGLCASPGQQSPCRWCSERPPAYEGIRAPFLFQGAIKESVHLFKYRGVKAAAPELARLLADYLKLHPLAGDVIMPVPLHPRRLRERGYNQSALLAKELGKITGVRVESRLLTRTKDGLPQVHTTSRNQRWANVEGSFSYTGRLSGKAVILVDDVATTGSTLSDCAAVLKKSGAASVWGLVLAREG